jgi:hypothetical protein
MNPLSKRQQLNTIDDNRWEIFQKSVRQRRMIAIGVTLVSGVTAFAMQNIWIFLAGEAGLWLVLLIWRQLKK